MIVRVGALRGRQTHFADRVIATNYFTTNGPGTFRPTSTRRQAIYNKLDKIVLDDISFENQPLSEVVLKLNEESKKHDPGGAGVPFIFPPPTPGALGFDMYVGNVLIPGGSSPSGVGTIPIRISPALHSARLADVLAAIVKGADKPISYSVEDYAVVFSAKTGPDAEPLYVQVFKVDRNAFLLGLERELGPGNTVGPNNVSEAARTFFTKLGVDMSPPKSVSFNEGEATLIVRSTLRDLDTVERAIMTINMPTPQLNIKAKWVAMPEQDVKEFWKSLGTPTNVTSFTGILTEPKMAVVLRALEGNPKANLVTEASVTTLSGRQTQIQVVDFMTVVTGIDPKALTPPGVATNAFLTTTLPMGPTLDFNPYVGRDGQTVHLGVIATISEFLGYEKPTNSVTVYVNGKKSQTMPPLPHFHLSQVTTNVEIWDGQTLVLGGLQSEKVSVLKDKVPVLGDVPLLGSLFRSESKSTNNQQLLVFITPAIVDPNGKRIHPVPKQSASSK
jgi:hypothetical protein